MRALWLGLALAIAAVGFCNAQPFQTMEEVERFFLCKTTMIYGAPGPNALGTQVWYTSPNGAVHLWRPGMRSVFHGEARLETDLKSGNFIVSWRYPGRRWRDDSADNLSKQVVERLDGDVFRLEKRKAVPFMLPPDPTTLSTLVAKAKVDSMPTRQPCIVAAS